MRIILTNFRIIDENTDMPGKVYVENGIITAIKKDTAMVDSEIGNAAIIDGKSLSLSNELPVLMPAFVDLHAHFRDPGPFENNALPSEVSRSTEVSLPSEVLESASLAAAAGGFGTLVCMANTKPVMDTVKKAAALKSRSDALKLIDLYPVLSLTKGMEGKELSEIGSLSSGSLYVPLMLSEDGKDPADDAVFLAAMKEAKRIGVPVSCHCDFGGDENKAVQRVIDLGRKAGCRIHIAHVSTADAVDTIRHAKAAAEFALSCEVMPHHICLTTDDAKKLGEKTWGRVNPPLRSEEDRRAVIQALIDGTIDAIATDHAPHSSADKEAGAPGFSGLETAFAAVYTALVRGGSIGLKRLSSLMSAQPASLLGAGFAGASFKERGLMLPGYRADLVVVDTEASWVVDPAAFKSRGKNSAFAGRTLCGRILKTFHSGRVVFDA